MASNITDQQLNQIVDKIEFVWSSYVTCANISDFAVGLDSPTVWPLSISSIFFNLLVILILFKMKKQFLTQAQIQLICLAFSDMSVGLFFTSLAIWNMSCDCEDSQLCQITAIVLIFLQTAAHGISKWVTLYITFSRAKALGSTRATIQSPQRHLARAIAFTVLTGTLTAVAIGVIMVLYQSYDLAVFTIHFIEVSLMAVMTIFIVIRMRLRSIPPSIRRNTSGSSAKDECKKLVIYAALVFSATQIIDVICAGILVLDNFEYVHFPNITLLDSSLFSRLLINVDILNSSVNLFFYLKASAGFRNAFFELW